MPLQSDSSPGGRVSVAMATRNGAAFVAEQLESVLAQSHPVDEIVVSDDASTDETVALAERVVAASQPRRALVVRRNSHPLGATGNFASAIAACTGEFVFLCDQDDIWDADRVATAIATFAAVDRALLVACDAELVDSRGRRLGKRLWDTLAVPPAFRRWRAEHGEGQFELLLRRNLVTGAAVCFRRELFALAQPLPESWVHDEWLAILASLDDRVACVTQPLVHYRQHETNAIGVRGRGLRSDLQRLREARGPRNARLLSRAEALVTKLETVASAARLRAEPSAPGSPRLAQELQLARQKLEHERRRSALSVSRAARVMPIAGMVRRGDYARFGSGPRDALRDLVQPAG